MSLISAKESECLNNSDDHPLSHAFSGDPDGKQYLESDCDEQLIISVAFSQPVKLHSLQITAPQDGRDDMSRLSPEIEIEWYIMNKFSCGCNRSSHI